MYIVKLINGTSETIIHGNIEKITNGKIKEEINAIPSFSFVFLMFKMFFVFL